jgi:hypothetical protein
VPRQHATHWRGARSDLGPDNNSFHLTDLIRGRPVAQEGLSPRSDPVVAAAPQAWLAAISFFVYPLAPRRTG